MPQYIYFKLSSCTIAVLPSRILAICEMGMERGCWHELKVILCSVFIVDVLTAIYVEYTGGIWVYIVRLRFYACRRASFRERKTGKFQIFNNFNTKLI